MPCDTAASGSSPQLGPELKMLRQAWLLDHFFLSLSYRARAEGLAVGPSLRGRWRKADDVMCWGTHRSCAKEAWRATGCHVGLLWAQPLLLGTAQSLQCPAWLIIDAGRGASVVTVLDMTG
jgi:hypothetical protein